MNIERDITLKLIQWKSRTDRKPLILQGARQTGKTWTVREFGKNHFEYFVEINFEKTPEIADIFKNTKEISRIISQLSLYVSTPILPQKTLIFFDEIQECNEALNTLKYFSEDTPEYHVIAAGSLLGVALAKGGSFPVGKVNFLTQTPVTFKEFIRAYDKNIFQYTENLNIIENIPEFMANRLKELYKQYLIVGGMPEALVNFLMNKEIEKVEETLTEILNAYTLDFSKHIAPVSIPRLMDIWQSIPSQLSKENRKFIYKLVKEGARAREYENALEWLRLAGLIYKIYNTAKPYIPLKAYDDVSAFKIYLNDVGLLRRLANLPAETVLYENNIYTEFKGALTENFVLQSLVAQFDEMSRYWTSSGTAEVDFVIQHRDRIIPIEVKSEKNDASKSLWAYNNKYQPKLRIRFSMRNLQKDDNLLNIPLYLVDWTKKWIEMCE